LKDVKNNVIEAKVLGGGKWPKWGGESLSAGRGRRMIAGPENAAIE
jgi:hypothetical protein